MVPSEDNQPQQGGGGGGGQQQQNQQPLPPQGGFIQGLSQQAGGVVAGQQQQQQQQQQQRMQQDTSTTSSSTGAVAPVWARQQSQSEQSSSSPQEKKRAGLLDSIRQKFDHGGSTNVEDGGAGGVVDSGDIAVEEQQQGQQQRSPPLSKERSGSTNKGTEKMAELHRTHNGLSPRRRAKESNNTGGDISSSETMVSNFGIAAALDEHHLPLAIYSTTKLRSWRTGYPRTLSLHKTYFTTSDPDSGEITNQWSYTGLRQWMALPKEQGCILLEVVDSKESGGGGSTKLKFKLRGGDSPESTMARAEMLALMLRYKYESSAPSSSQQQRGGGGIGGGIPAVARHNFPTFVAARQTRHGTRTAVTLIAAPYGLVELVGNRVIRTYVYTTIVGVSLTADDPSGVVLHIAEVKPKAVARTAPGIGSTLQQQQQSNHPGRLYYVESSQRSGSGGGNGRSDLISSLNSYYGVLGISLQVCESTSIQNWSALRARLASPDIVGETISTFRVMKPSIRHAGDAHGGGVVPRDLVLTRGGYLVERDRVEPGAVNAGGVVSCRHLSAVRCVVRHETDSNQGTNNSGGPAVKIEFAGNSGDSTSGTARTYACSDRDALIVSVLDSARSLANNKSITVTGVRTAGYRLLGVPSTGAQAKGDLFHPHPIQIQCLKYLHQISCAAVAYLDTYGYSSFNAHEPVSVVEECDVVVEACHIFNANVVPNAAGILDGEKKIIGATLEALCVLLIKLLLSEPAAGEDKNDTGTDSGNILLHVKHRSKVERVATPLFQALYRLCCTATGFRTAVDCQDALDAIQLIWTVADSFTFYWATTVLAALLSRHSVDRITKDEIEKEAEFVNKRLLLGLKGTIDGLVGGLLGQRDKLSTSQKGSSVPDLILMVISSTLESVLCSNYDTTAPEHFSALLGALSSHHRALMSMLQSPIPLIIENTALILHLISTHSPETARAIREDSLSSAIILHHFHLAVFSPLEGQRFLSRYLCSLWFSGPPDCQEKRLLRRMIPHGFLAYLKMPLLSQAEEDQLDDLERGGIEASVDAQSFGLETGGGTNTKRLRSRISMAVSAGTPESQPENFRIFFHVMTKDHALPDLIWNQETRRELRIALEAELQSIHRVMEARGGPDKIAWNHQQFAVTYASLKDEVQVGNVYMRLWLQTGDGFIMTWDDPGALFELLFRRLLGEINRDTVVTNMCVRCLERLYAIHWAKVGVFSDIMILVHSMSQTTCIETQHRILSLVATLLGVSEDPDKYGTINADQLLLWNDQCTRHAEQLLNSSECVECINLFSQLVAWGHTTTAQVANMLTSAVGGSANSSTTPMITDGTDNGPAGQPTDGKGKAPQQSSSAGIMAVDSSCPAVWFVARGGKIPPPQSTVRGPFRVSELVGMMQEGELHPHSLVTSLHTEDYSSEDSEDGGVSEAHIDTGKWFMLVQVWQLRWQLCADGSSTGVYGPADVALMALRSLSRLVDLHKSLDPRGIPYYPIPIAKRLLCGFAHDPSASGGSRTSDSAMVMNTRDSLSIIAQALLCNDPRVVESSAVLLSALMSHNDDACAKLYLTGVFFFACMYTGSNFQALAKLLQECHLKQVFRSGYAAAASSEELSVKDRSILGNLLPEGLLLVLVNYGYERFANVFVGNFDTPEVIWSFEMRKHLVEMVRQHIGDFPERLKQNTTTKFDYCPMPGVAYRRLEKEIFCHNYYLNNLCDETRFPDWPIAEPVEVFRACLNEWKQQMSRDQVQEEDAQENARKLLGLKAGDSGSELRKAYRVLARQYHPDKNPAGREMFEKVQKSYELLLPVVEQGGKIQAITTDDNVKNVNSDEEVSSEAEDNAAEGWSGGKAQMQNVHLLLRTQLLICKRYGSEMSAYKYPAYGMLLACLKVPASDSTRMTDARDKGAGALLDSCILKPKRAEVIQTAAALVFASCLVSPLNAEELVSERGMSILEKLLCHYVGATLLIETSKESQSKLKSLDTTYATIIDIVHTIGGVSFFESGRAALLALDNVSDLCINWRRCIDGTLKNKANASLLKKHALEGIANMSHEAELQRLLVRTGIVWPLVRCLLNYDPTLEDVPATCESDVDKISQAASNEHAAFAARALGMLCGVMKGNLHTPRNKELYEAMRTLLTKPIAKMLRNERSIEILRTLNSNAETPTFVWNIQMRDELKLFLDKMESGRDERGFQSIENELQEITSSFHYSNLASEVVIGGVYLRIFNGLGDGREGIRKINDCSVFAKELVLFLARCLESSDELPSASFSFVLWATDDKEEQKSDDIEKDTEVFPVSDKRFTMAIDSLRLLVRLDGLIDDVLCDEGCPAALLHLLELPHHSEAFDTSCDILTVMAPKQCFADAAANQNELWRLLRVLERSDQACEQEVSPSSDTIDSEEKGGSPEVDEEEDAANARKTSRRQERAWEILESLSSSPSIGTALVKSGSWLELLGILVGYSDFTKIWTARLGAARTISRLLWAPKSGPLLTPLLLKFLPNALVATLKDEGAEAMLRVFDKESETPELIWDSDMRSELRNGVKEVLDRYMKSRKRGGDVSNDDEDYVLPATFLVRYKKLQGELYIGGVYVRLFLKEPTFRLRDPSWFLESLLLRWTQELNAFTDERDSHNREGDSTSTALTRSESDVLELVTSASVYLCKIQSALCSKLADWGYMIKAIGFVHSAVARELIGSPLLSAIRLIHVAASERVNIEAMAMVGDANGSNGLVDGVVKAINGNPLHEDTGFMVEALEKVFKGALGDVDDVVTTDTICAAIEPGYTEPIIHQQSQVPEPNQDPTSTAVEETWQPSQPTVTMPSSAEENSDRAMVMGGQSSVRLNYAPGSSGANFHHMAPSPAPGLEPVSKMDPGMDPLSLLGASTAPAAAPASTTSASKSAPAPGPVSAQMQGPTNVSTSVQQQVAGQGTPGSTAGYGGGFQRQQPVHQPSSTTTSFAARSQAAYSSSPAAPARATGIYGQPAPQQSQPHALGFAARSQMVQSQQSQPNVGYAARSHASVSTQQAQSPNMGFAARSQAMAQQQQQQQQQQNSALMHGRYYGTPAQPPPSQMPSTLSGQTQQFGQQQIDQTPNQSQRKSTSIGCTHTRPQVNQQAPAPAAVGYAGRSQQLQQQAPAPGALGYAARSQVNKQAPAPADVYAPHSRVQQQAASATGYAARSRQVQQQASAPGLGYAARSQMMASTTAQVNQLPQKQQTPQYLQQPVSSPALAQASQQQQQQSQTMTSSQQQEAPALLTGQVNKNPPQEQDAVAIAAPHSVPIVQGHQQTQPQISPGSLDGAVAVQTTQQYGQAPGNDATLMHGRYYGTPAQPQQQQQPQSHHLQQPDVIPQLQKEQALANQGAVPQPQMQVPSSAPAPAPAPQPKMPTPIGGSGIDARSSADPTLVAEQKIVETTGAPGSAQGRVALLNAALNCKLPRFLVDKVLENPSLSTVKDPAGAKVHSVELLKLLAKDPSYGMKFGLMLDSLSGWEKYRSQDHSLFITGVEHKGDYFLTDGGASSVKLLTQEAESSCNKHDTVELETRGLDEDGGATSKEEEGAKAADEESGGAEGIEFEKKCYYGSENGEVETKAADDADESSSKGDNGEEGTRTADEGVGAEEKETETKTDEDEAGDATHID